MWTRFSLAAAAPRADMRLDHLDLRLARRSEYELGDVLAAEVDPGTVGVADVVTLPRLEQRADVQTYRIAMLTSDATDTDVRLRSTWLMNPLVRRVSWATCSSDMPRR